MTSTGKHVVRLTYTADTDGEPSLQGEHIAYKWLSLEEIKQLEGLDGYFKQLLESRILANEE